MEKPELIMRVCGLIAILLSFYLSGFSVAGFLNSELAFSSADIGWMFIVGFSVLFLAVFIGLLIANITGNTGFLMAFIEHGGKSFEGIVESFWLKIIYIGIALFSAGALSVILAVFGIKDNTPLIFIGILLLLYGTRPRWPLPPKKS